jgi:hypothetical protein
MTTKSALRFKPTEYKIYLLHFEIIQIILTQDVAEKSDLAHFRGRGLVGRGLFPPSRPKIRSCECTCCHNHGCQEKDPNIFSRCYTGSTSIIWIVLEKVSAKEWLPCHKYVSLTFHSAN